MAKLPYYKRYPRDYLADENVAMMSLEEEGAYNRLLDYCWLQGSIPADVNKLARLCRTTSDKMAELWFTIEPCFDDEGDGRLTHPRLEKERAEAEGRSEAASNAAKIRWEKEKAERQEGEGNADAMRSHTEAQCETVPYTEADTDTEADTETTSDANASSSDCPADGMHNLFTEVLGGDPPHPKLTTDRRAKYRALWEEHLVGLDDWRTVWRALLLAITDSSHHMSQRSYQMPESFLRNENRRDTWMQKAAVRLSGRPEMTDGDRKLLQFRRRIEGVQLEEGSHD